MNDHRVDRRWTAERVKRACWGGWVAMWATIISALVLLAVIVFGAFVYQMMVESPIVLGVVVVGAAAFVVVFLICMLVDG